jgi:hypothetical protein
MTERGYARARIAGEIAMFRELRANSTVGTTFLLMARFATTQSKTTTH